MSNALPWTAAPQARLQRARAALAAHAPEYAMEAAGLAIFMLSACAFSVLLEHPGSPLRAALPDAALRRVGIGIAMGLTAIGIICSPWGQRSGAHLNPAVTLSFLWLGKIAAEDALFYVAAQFAGGVLGVALAALLLGSLLADPAVRYAITVPGPGGAALAFGAEAAISCGLLLAVLASSNHPRASAYTPLLAGALIAIYIAAESPLSGMSMNPARTLGSAVFAREFRGLWIYFVAPPLGMLGAAALYTRAGSARAVYCAKLHHRNARRCIFGCDYPALAARREPRTETPR